jgi:hypothetical protein
MTIKGGSKSSQVNPGASYVQRVLCHPSESWGLEKNMNTDYVYILASKRNGTLYTGVTNNLQSAYTGLF